MTLSTARFRARRLPRCLLAATALCLAGQALAGQGTPAGAERVYSRPGHRWFEDAAANTAISSDAKWVFLGRAGGVDLVSLTTQKDDPARLRSSLDSVSKAVFCGNDL